MTNSDNVAPATGGAGTGPTPLLEVRDAVVHYGRIEALHGVSLTVNAGELVTLLGCNGAGKTTLMRALSGLRPLSKGSIWFDGREITRVKAHQRVIDGLVQAPEGRGVFPGMTVLDNLEMGCYGRKFDTKAAHDERLDWVFATFPRLAERRKQMGGTLSGGEQQMLAMARILRSGARLLLLDEISEGLAPVIVQKLAEVIRSLKEKGFTIILVEQNFRFAAPLADRMYIVEHGRIVAEIGKDELERKQALLHEYLGV